MKVLLILLSDFWMIRHLVPQWEKIADEVHIFYYPEMGGWQTGEWPATRKQKLDELKSLLSRLKNRLDLIFAVAYDDFLDEEFLRRAGHIPVINLHVDADTQWHRVLRTAKYYSLLVFTHRDPAVLSYMNRFTKAVYQPMAANPDYFTPLRVEKRYDVIFAGAYDAVRGRILEAVCDITNDVAIFGGRWKSGNERPFIKFKKKLKGFVQKSLFDLYYVPHILSAQGFSYGVDKVAKALKRGVTSVHNEVYSGRKLSGKINGFLSSVDYVRVLNSSRVVLGINQRGSMVSHRLRDMEIPSMGLLYMPQRFPELSELFREGEEVIAWTDEKELKTALKELLHNQERIKQIGEKARERVVKDHSWEKRFRDMLALL